MQNILTSISYPHQ